MILLNEKFRTDTPVLPEVKLIDVWASLDGPLFGVCQVNGQELFFCDVVFDIWRYYAKGDHQRLWAIYAAYDIEIDRVKEIMGMYQYRQHWESDLIDDSNVVGIFWEYSK